MKAIAIAALVSVTLMGCSQTPTKEAKIEERAQPVATAPAAATPPKETVETRGLSGTETDALALAGRVPPKNATGPLANRVIHFDFDSSAIREEYRSTIEAHSTFLKNSKAAKVILQGHTDERGSREYNVALGQRRADAVKQAMSLLGVPETQLESVSFGEEKPVAECHDESCYQQNRRAVIVYDGE